MRKNHDIIWEYKDKVYTVGESLADSGINGKIVWYKGHLYYYYINGSQNRICLIDIYDQNKRYWTSLDKVFNIIEVI